MLWLLKINFSGFRRFLIHGNSSYVVLYTQCLRYNICNAWFLDIRISTCFQTALTGKQTIASPLNKDHRATYHQGEVSITQKQSLKVPAHFY